MASSDPVSVRRLRVMAKVGDAASGALRTALRPTRTLGFPYRRPTVPHGVAVPAEPERLGAHYATDWARRSPARAARRMILAGPMRMLVRAVASPEIVGADRLADLVDADPPVALIFAPNHHSHIDTPLVLTSLPRPWRSKVAVAAAADYFFDTRTKAALAALALNAVPIEREVTSRTSSDTLRRLLDTGWSVVIYPEGGRSPDGWGQDFKGGAAYLSGRTGAPVVPMFIDGTGPIYGKGMKRPKPGRTTVVFGAPMMADDGENTRRFNARIEAAVARLGDEALTDAWTARRRAATGTSTRLTGPDHQGWRRQWALAERRKLGRAGQRLRQRRRWPDLG